jgi:predicted Zn-dependent protease
LGSAPEALAEIRRAREVDPLSPIINAEVGYFHVFARQYEQAIQEAQRALELDPTFPSSYRILAHAYALQGKREEAKAAVERVVQLSQGIHEAVGLCGQILAFAGYTEEAQKSLQELARRSETEYVFPAILAISYATLDDTDQAFHYFEEAIEERTMVASWLRDPILDDIASDARFRNIFERMGLRP